MISRGLNNSNTFPNPTGMFNHCPQSAGLVEHPTVPNFPGIVALTRKKGKNSILLFV